MKVTQEPDGQTLIHARALAEPLDAQNALVFARQLQAEALKAHGRNRRTLTLPLLDGTQVFMEGWWPCGEESFTHMLSLLEVMRPGLVEAEET